MNPVIKVAIAVAIVATALWWVVGKFLGGTEAMSESLDVRSLSYLRDHSGATSTATGPARDYDTSTDELKRSNSVIADPQEPAQTANTTGEKQQTASSADPADDETVVPETVSDLAENADAELASLDDALVNEPSENLGLEGAQERAEVTDSPEETEAEARARRLKEKLGIKKPKPPTRAVDVKLVLSSECDASGVALAPVSVQYRFESPTIRGTSLNQLEILVSEYRDCPDGVFELTENVLGKVDATPTLTQMRFDELKYFFIQHSVPKTALRYPESS